MRRALLLGLAMLCPPVLAQYDAGGQNTQGANIDASKLDPATRARIRVEGAVGGIPERAASDTQQAGSASAGASAVESAKQDGAVRDNAKGKPAPQEKR